MLNSATQTEARDHLLSCCGSQAWVDRMLERRPYAGDGALLAAAADVWSQSTTDDLLQAFAAHPQIGDLEALRKRYEATQPRESAGDRSANHSASEQSSVEDASDEVLEELATLNALYLQRFGFIFIVCATGKSAAEMRDLLKKRVGNSRDEELRNAAREQLEITLLRLGKLGD